MHPERYHLVSSQRLERLQNLIEEVQELIIEFKYESDGYLNVATREPLLRRPISPPLPTEEELAEIF